MQFNGQTLNNLSVPVCTSFLISNLRFVSLEFHFLKLNIKLQAITADCIELLIVTFNSRKIACEEIQNYFIHTYLIYLYFPYFVILIFLLKF